ncbi:MAG: Ribonuclease 3 [Candidatus Anoxychlamydiales bacterium]|nr:Ribonuclease 3 [Candidatus Anoxychlamydiales bacterium]NGX36674.1 Ribonuclease 3 [Candidatus Anoxychlamydiales bacterium]
MNEYLELKESIGEVEKKINLTFENKDLLLLSFVHRSFFNENKKVIQEHNERLEFLGDAALSLVVSHYLYSRFPNYPEGKLSHIRSRLVDATSCTNYYKLLDVKDFLLLGRGEKDEKRGKASIFSDAFEALIGAIFLDKGFEGVKDFILKNFENFFEEIALHPEADYKGAIQEYSQKKYQTQPEYKILKEEGPEHLKEFHVVVIINNKKLGCGKGKSKKQAEQMAAEEAFNNLKLGKIND